MLIRRKDVDWKRKFLTFSSEKLATNHLLSCLCTINKKVGLFFWNFDSIQFVKRSFQNFQHPNFVHLDLNQNRAKVQSTFPPWMKLFNQNDRFRILSIINFSLDFVFQTAFPTRFQVNPNPATTNLVVICNQKSFPHTRITTKFDSRFYAWLHNASICWLIGFQSNWPEVRRTRKLQNTLSDKRQPLFGLNDQTLINN